MSRAFARSWQTAALASPSTGGAVTQIFSSWGPATSILFRLLRGVTRTWKSADSGLGDIFGQRAFHDGEAAELGDVAKLGFEHGAELA